jgi:hypothetical protein
MSTAEQVPADNGGWEWALVEIMGHRSHWGRVREEERFGAKMLRIDVPSFKKTAELEVVGDSSSASVQPPEPEVVWSTHYYGGPSIFSFTLTDEATVMKRNRPYEPPHRLTYQRPAPEADEPPEGYGEFD